MSDNMCSVICILKALGFIQSECWQTFSIQDQIINISGFSGHTVSVATIQLRNCSTKVAIDNTYVNGHSCFNKTCFIEVWLLGHSLPTCDLYSTSKIPLLNTECYKLEWFIAKSSMKAEGTCLVDFLSLCLLQCWTSRR